MSKKLTKRIFSILTELIYQKEKKGRKNSISSRVKKENIARSLFFA
jgi:hypothetical protein